MTTLTEQTVGQIVAENPARARVFEKYRIDYCCGGKIPLGEACDRRKANLDEVVRELDACDAAGNENTGRDWTTAPLAELAKHIVSTHHSYLRTELPRLETMAERVAKVHGSHAPRTIELHAVFIDFRRELEDHAMKEEQILFPWIERLESGVPEAGPFGASVSQPILCMEHEHDDAGAALEKMRELTDDFQPPADACNTWRVLYASLAALEQDMHTHIHKENSILFPRAMELERKASA